MVFKCVVPRTIVKASPANMVEMQIMGPTSVLLNYRTLVWGLATFTITLPPAGDSDSHWYLRATGVTHCISGQRRRRLVGL